MNLRNLFFVFVLFFLIVSRSFGANAPVSQISDQQVSDFSLAGYEDKGKKSWDISGKSADIFDNIVKLKEVSGNLYGKEENVNLTSKTGDFNKDDGRVHLEKDVVITTSKGAKLTTNSMDWDRKNQLVTTPDRVNIEKANMNITAIGAHGEPDLKKVSLTKDVRLDINPSTALTKSDDIDVKEKITVTCDGSLTIDYEKNIATFNENVKVERPDLIITSDIMDLYFIAKKTERLKTDKTPEIMGNNSIDKIVARGNVKIVRGENTSFSEEAIYNATDKKIVLSGKPRLVFYSTEDFKNASFGN